MILCPVSVFGDSVKSTLDSVFVKVVTKKFAGFKYAHTPLFIKLTVTHPIYRNKQLGIEMIKINAVFFKIAADIGKLSTPEQLFKKPGLQKGKTESLRNTGRYQETGRPNHGLEIMAQSFIKQYL